MWYIVLLRDRYYTGALQIFILVPKSKNEALWVKFLCIKIVNLECKLVRFKCWIFAYEGFAF